MNNSDLENVWLGKGGWILVQDQSFGQSMGFPEMGRDIKAHFKEGNLNKIHAPREKSRYEARAKLGTWVCSRKNPLHRLYSFDTFALRQRDYH